MCEERNLKTDLCMSIQYTYTGLENLLVDVISKLFKSDPMFGMNPVEYLAMLHSPDNIDTMREFYHMYRDLFRYIYILRRKYCRLCGGSSEDAIAISLYRGFLNTFEA